MSAIRKELMEAAEITPKRGEAEQAFLLRLQKAISEEITEDVWTKLSILAQDWNNDAADAITAGTPIPPFADEAAPAPAEAPAGGRRRGGAATPAPAPVAYEPKEGDEVVATTKRGKEIKGFIVEIKDGVAYINADKQGDEKDDQEAALDTCTFRLAGDTQAPAEPEGPADPEVGDTVQVETARGKVIMGKLTVLEGDEIVLVDSTGADHELSISKLKSFVLKSKGAAAPAPAPETGRRGRGAAAPAPAAAGDKTKRASNPAGVSVGQRINEIVIDNPTMKVEDVGAALKKEGLEFRDNTLGMTYSAAHKFLNLLRDRKLIK